MKGPAQHVAQASVLARSGDLRRAESVLRLGLRRTPDDPDSLQLLGLVLLELGNVPQAQFFLERACRQAPASASCRSSLGDLHAISGRAAEAIGAYRAALELDARCAAAHRGLAGALARTGDFLAAERAGREALAIEPEHMGGYINLAWVLQESGRAPEAYELLSRASGLFPGSPIILTTLLSTANYVVQDGAELEAPLRALGRALQRPEAHRFTNSPDPERRLRVGIISGDLRSHSVAFFLGPILESHSSDRLEIICYSTRPGEDDTSARLRSHSDGWVDAAGLGPDAFIDRLRRDRLDIAVDLAGHSQSSRVMELSRRAAPVQVSYLGYPASTGVPNMDYRIVDDRTDPPDAWTPGPERLVRISPCFLLYAPPGDAPAVGPLPAGPVTFGSFNAMAKISPATLDLWSSVLDATPGSRLLLKNRSLAHHSVRERLLLELAGRGVAEDRIELLPTTAGRREHLETYARTHIALDTFPYAGTTTTCEALWMGVPVVSLRGKLHAGRVGCSILGTLGLDSLVAATSNEFVRIARELAGNPAELARFRGTLRERVASSKLCDKSSFGVEFEAALRSMWRTWCRSPAG